MFDRKTIFKRLRQTLVAGLVVSLVWLQGLGVQAVQAANLSQNAIAADNNTIAAQPRILDEESATEYQGKRYQAVLDCFPEELGLNERDTQRRIQRVLDEWGNDQFERALDLTDNPELSDAEIKFERCLENKGYTPQRKLQSLGMKVK
jgi:hypothetical protein